jgi:hypothetical protein
MFSLNASALFSPSANAIKSWLFVVSPDRNQQAKVTGAAVNGVVEADSPWLLARKKPLASVGL